MEREKGFPPPLPLLKEMSGGWCYGGYGRVLGAIFPEQEGQGVWNGEET